MLRAAIIGLGEISNIHLPVLLESVNMDLAAVCDIDPAMAAKAPGTKFYTGYREMLAAERLDCVHICLPHYLHYPVARYVIEQGVNVFCEKPLAMNLAEARDFVALEESHPELKIGICFQNRYNESFQMLMHLVAEGQMGRVTGIKGIVPWFRALSYYTDKPWRMRMSTAGGGVMINQSIHTMDLMQLIGGEIASIRGSIANLLDYDGLEVEDTASARMEFKNGAQGFFFATTANSRNDSVEIEVTLEQGELILRDCCLYRQNDGVLEQLVEDDRLAGTKFYFGASHGKIIRQFYECLETGSHEYVHARDALTSMRMIDAIRRSSEEKVSIAF